MARPVLKVKRERKHSREREHVQRPQSMKKRREFLKKLEFLEHTGQDVLGADQAGGGWESEAHSTEEFCFYPKTKKEPFRDLRRGCHP